MFKMYATSVLPRDRFVIGPFGDVGYIARRPGHGETMEKMLEVRSRNRFWHDSLARKRKDLKKDAYLNAYYRKFDELSVRAAVNRLAELGMEEADKYFRVKQNKLRQILLEDHSKMVQEYTIKAQNATEEKLAREKLQAEDIAKKKTNDDALRAQQIYQVMAMKNSEEYREKLQMANLKNISESHREQIRVHKDLKRMEREENEAWDARREEEYKEAKLEEQRKNIEIAEEKRFLSESLNRQVEENEHIRRKQFYIEEVDEERNKEIRKVWEDALLRRDEEATRRRKSNEEALSKQIKANRLLAEQYHKDEFLFEKIMEEDKAKKAERDAAARKFNRTEAWKELVGFKESVVQYRDATTLAENEAERNAEENRNIYERKRWEVKRSNEKWRKDLRTDCVETSKLMANDKKKMREELEALDNKYGQLTAIDCAINDKLDEELRLRRAVDRIAFNKAQTRYLAQLQTRQKTEDEEMLRKMRCLSEENSLRVKAALERPVAEIAGTSIHPFQNILRARNS